MKIEKKKVTYPHTVDNQHGKRVDIPMGGAVRLNTSLKEALDAVANQGRLKLEYNVGKKPETKKLQTLK